MRQNSGLPVSDGTYNIAFGLFQNNVAIWGKTYSVIVTDGLLSATLTGVGGNQTSLPAGTGMNLNFTGATLNAALLAAAANGPIMVRIYAVSAIDGANPQFDVNVAASPTAYVAETSKAVTNGAVTLSGLAATAYTNSSAGAADAGKLVALDAAGLVALNMIPSLPAGQINSGQVGLGNGGTGSTDGSITGSGNVTYQSASGSTTTVGNNSGTSTVALQSGTGGISAAVTGTTGNVSFTAGSTSGNINLTPGTTSGAITIGSASSTGATIVGNAGGASSTTIRSGTGHILLSPSSTGTVRVTNGNGLNLINGAGSITINAPLNPTSYSFILPNSAGSNGQVLTTDGAGILTWSSAGAGSVMSVGSGVGLLGGPITGSGTLSVDVGTTANKVLQLNGSAQIPAVDGSLLTNVNASRIGSRTVSSAAPTATHVLTWNGSQWEPAAPTAAGISALTGDVSASGSGSVAATIAKNAVSSAKIQSSGIGTNLLLITDASTGATVDYASCALGEVLKWTAVGWDCATDDVASGTLTYVGAGTGILGGPITGTGTLSVDVGTSANKILQLNGSAQIPAVDGSLLTSVNAVKLQGVNISATAPTSGYVLKYNGSAWVPAAESAGSGTVTNVATTTDLTGGPITGSGTIGVNTGTGANQILKLNGSAQIPAVDGSLLTNVNASRIGSRTVSSAAPTATHVLTWNGSQWEPTAPGGGGITALTGDVVASGSGSVAATISDDVITSAKLNSTGIGINQLVITDSSTGATLDYATCAVGEILKWTATGWICSPDAGLTSAVSYLGAGAGLLGGPVSSTGTLSVDVGTTANKILQLNGSGQIPAVDGSLLTNVNASRIGTRTVSSAAPLSNYVLAWNGSQWEPSAPGGVSFPMLSSTDGSAAAPAYSFASGTGDGLYRSGTNTITLSTAGTARLTVDAVGRVGIGTTAPSQALEVNGIIRATNLLLTSDRRAKHDIVSLDHADALNRICSLRPVAFRWNSDGVADEGVIAQELRQIYPEFVIENPDGSLSVKYSSLIAPLIASVQQLRSEKSGLEERMNRVEQENRELKEKVNQILNELRKGK